MGTAETESLIFEIGKKEIRQLTPLQVEISSKTMQLFLDIDNNKIRLYYFQSFFAFGDLIFGEIVISLIYTSI